MNKKSVICSALIAVLLFLVQFGVGSVARLFYLHPTGRMTADIQRQNILVANYASWIFTLIVAAVMISLYLRDRRQGYRQLFIQIATVEGVLTVLGGIRGVIAAHGMPETSVSLAANLSWIALMAPLGFLKETFLVGLIASAVIASINRIRPIEDMNASLPSAAPDVDERLASVATPIFDRQAPTIHPLAYGVLVGGSAGLLFSVTAVLILKLSGSYAMLLMFYFPSVTGMVTEFSGPFVPEYFQAIEPYFGDVMAVLIHTSMGIVIASIVAYREAHSARKAEIIYLLRIAVYVGFGSGALRGISGQLLASLHFNGVISSPIVWTIGAIIVGLMIIFIRRFSSTVAIPSLSAPLVGARQAIVAGGMLLVTASLVGQGMDIALRRSLSDFSRKMDNERKQRESSDGLRIDKCQATWEPSGDLIVTGLVTNSTEIHKAWSIEAETLDNNGRVITTARLVDGRQHFSLKELALLSGERALPECVVRAPERQVAAKSTSRFEIRLIQPPPEAVNYSLALKSPQYNEIAANDLQDMKGVLEKQYAEIEKNGGKLPEPKATKLSINKAQIDKLGVNVYLGTNYTTDMEATTKESIFRLRKQEIDKYRALKIYPANYIPSKSIFGQIDDKIDWLHDTPLFLMNPYLLIIEAGGAFINGEFAYCPVSSVTYSKNQIAMQYENESAKKWLRNINGYKECAGTIRLWFVNAVDAGFPYVYVDSFKSENIEPVPGAPTGHVMNSVYAPAEFFHVGRKGKNNISPDDARAKLKLKNPHAKTTIHAKLWRKKPASIAAPEDFSYVIQVKPDV